MSYIPNCREDEYYNFETLDATDQMVVTGYDYLAEDVIGVFFDNLDMFDFDIEGEDINIGRFFQNHPKIATAFQDALSDFIEGQRNELIVSILDSYDYPDDEDEEEIIDDTETEIETDSDTDEEEISEPEIENGDVDG